MDTLPLRYRVALLAALALVPGVLFLLDRSEMTVALSLACVVVIAASLAWMFGPAESEADTERGDSAQR